MIIRLVKLTIEIDQIESFVEAFNTHKNEIRAFNGCSHLELLEENNDSGVVFTYSKWNSQNDLESYRNSNLFKGIWSTVKPMFSAKPEAWSTISKFEV